MQTVLEIKNITKRYPGVVALDNISMSFEAGEVHSIMGENGAGKSTLIKAIAGAIKPDEGEIIINGEHFTELTPALSRNKGIGVIYQEFNNVPEMNVAENVFLGEKIGGKVVADIKEMHRLTAEKFKEFNMNIDTHRMLGELSTAEQQMVEIVKAICKDVQVLIMDEPSAAISVKEVEKMFEIIQMLKQKGVTIIYISHRMDEVFEISDRVSIIRDGTYVGTEKLEDTSRKNLINMMVGRELNEAFPTRNVELGDVILETKDLCGNGDFNINIQLREKEILGLGGLVGAGRTELAKVLFGVEKSTSGELIIKGKSVKFYSSKDAINMGIGLIPEDRKREGAFLNYSIDWNIGIMALKRLTNGLAINEKKAREESENYAKVLKIKTPSLKQLVKNLSGGNQQKVVVAKVLASEADILIFDEPTRGIDVAAKQEIYRLMNQLVEQGKSIIMISSEMEELLGMSDRIVVLYEGEQTGELLKPQFSQQAVLELASGMKVSATI